MRSCDHVRKSEELGAACKPLDAGVTDGNLVLSKAGTGAGKKDANTIKVLGEVKLPAAQPTQIDISILRSEPQIRPRRLMKAPRARNLGINRKQDSLYLRPVPAQLRSQPSLD